MTVIEKILELLKQKGIEQQKFASDIGIKKQKVSEWKSGKTKSYIKYLDKIAKYFDVTTDYLLGNNEFIITGNEKLLLEEYRKLKPEEQEQILQNIKNVL